MKKIYYLLFTSIFAGGGEVKSQPVNFNAPTLSTDCIDFNTQCSNNLINPLFEPGTIYLPKDDGTEDIVYGVTNANYTDAQYAEADGDCNVFSTNSCDRTGYESTLRYNVYYPTTYNFVDCPALPAIIFVHGGGFSECSSFKLNNTTVIRNLLIELAARGYVVFNVEYRRGRELDGNGIIYKSVQQQLTSYRIAQDIRGAIRSIIKRQLNEGTGTINDNYRININKLFLAGNSGGAYAVLSAYFYQTQPIINQVFPKASSSSVTIASALGNIGSAYYYAETNNTAYDYFTRIKGILNLWSGVTLPNALQTNADFNDIFTDIIVPPIISFVGQNDGVFPPDNTPVNFSPYTMNHFKYNKANYDLSIPDYNDCTINDLQFQLDKIISENPDLHFWGARKLYELLQYQGVLSELYIDCQARHGLDNDGSGFESDYGTGAHNQKDVYIYIAQRAATFFQLCLANITGGLTTTKFIESRNNRNTCNLSDNYTLVCTECTHNISDYPCYDPTNQ